MLGCEQQSQREVGKNPPLLPVPYSCKQAAQQSHRVHKSAAERLLYTPEGANHSVLPFSLSAVLSNLAVPPGMERKALSTTRWAVNGSTTLGMTITGLAAPLPGRRSLWAFRRCVAGIESRGLAVLVGRAGGQSLYFQVPVIHNLSQPCRKTQWPS